MEKSADKMIKDCEEFFAHNRGLLTQAVNMSRVMSDHDCTTSAKFIVEMLRWKNELVVDVDGDQLRVNRYTGAYFWHHADKPQPEYFGKYANDAEAKAIWFGHLRSDAVVA